MPSLHFIIGSTGAGKSSYAQHLAESLGAFRFSLDEWLKTLYWMDAPPQPSFEWIMERTQRCEALAKRLAEQALAARQVVVIDFGFSESAQRERFYKWAKSNGVSYRVHFLDIPRDERWRRVAKRNDDPNLKSIKVSRETFDLMERYFDPPSADELVQNNGIRLALDNERKR